MKKTDYAKYIVTFLVTAGLFATVFYVSKTVSDEKLKKVKTQQDALSINLLSSEVQFSLLKSGECRTDGTSLLTPEIRSLGQRLDFLENQLGTSNEDVINLKKYYSLLQIKDYVLTKELASRCKTKPVTVLYFYTKDCEECTKQGYSLTSLNEKYPQIKIYSFDKDLDLAVIQTLEGINLVTENAPNLVIDGLTYNGFKSLEDIEKVLGKNLEKLITEPTDKKDKSSKSLPIKNTQ